MIYTFTGCARQIATGPSNAFREINAPQLTDDLLLDGLSDAIDAQSQALLGTASTVMTVGPISISRGEYRDALTRLREILQSPRSIDEKFSYIRDNFRFFEFFGGTSWGDVLLTSYFEPTIPGSLSPSNKFSRPLYAKPADLLTISLNSFSERFSSEKPLKGRTLEDRVVPFFTREEIDGRQVLRGRSLELVWVDPIDAFFLQIQGSGTVVLPDGEEVFIVYADKNGHRYEAIGKFLKDQIAPKKVTMQRLEAWLRSMSPIERDKILFMNPSYVFFQRSKQRAITSIGAPATPGRTIAADPRFAPKGALAYLQFEKPVFEPHTALGEDPQHFKPVARFVMDQDSGGAITGTERIDLFWGRGDEAKRYAGVMQNRAKIIYLVPR